MKYIRFISLFILFFTCTLTFSQNTRTQYLSGTGSDNTVYWDFYCTAGSNSGQWTKIPVPSCWETEGFGSYNYGYDSPEGRADEKGIYKYSFTVPANWKGDKVNIVFEGSMTDTEVKINGKSAGPIHQGAFYRFRYDISNLLNYEGDNLLEVTVSKVSSNVSVNKAEREADYWVFGGIFRPVFLEALPKTHIRYISINPTAEGELITDVFVEKTGNKDDISIQLFDVNGKEMHSVLGDYLKEGNKFSLTGNYENIKPWSTESPNLYTLVAKLTRKGKVIHEIDRKIGFRTIEVKERDGVYLNGVKIKFKGVNRHSFFPSTGRTLNKDMSIEDVLLVKEMNMNAIRNAHYPADQHFYDVCDSLGIMVLDELGGWHDAYDTEVGTKLVKEMMYKSMNHPCVVMWVNGNEGGHNRELLPLYDKIDIQKRPVLQAWELFSGFDTQHYRDYDYGIGNHYQGHAIVMPTEFLHGMYDGGHGAGLEDFWKTMWDNPLSAGGFLWDYADEAVVRTDKDGELDSDGNHGADGILGPYKEKEGSFFTIKEVWAPLFFEHKEITSQFDGTLFLENRYHFTNTTECKFQWELAKVAYPEDSSRKETVSGIISSPDIAPGDKGSLQISLPKNWSTYDVLYVTAIDKQEREIFTWNWPIKLPVDMVGNVLKKTGSHIFKISETDSMLIAKSEEMSFSFDKNSGLLADIRNPKGKISLSNGPVLCEGDAVFKKLAHRFENDTLLIETEFEENSILKQCLWTIYPSGWMRLDITYSPEIERHDLLGISFDYPEELVQGIEWMGDGPYRVWKNRMRGNNLGVWLKDYNNTITGQSEFIYPEFKGYHSRMYWLKVLSSEQSFTVLCPDEDLFFRMYTPGTPEDPYNTAPKFPSGDISFMHGITPMGTKSLQPFRMGPMSDQNIYYTYGGNRPLKMVLYFDFRANE
jgi:hypothetical protein